MSLQQTLQVFELLDSAWASGEKVRGLLAGYANVEVTVKEVHGAKGKTDFIKIVIPGFEGKRLGGSAPTLGIVGRLGGIGARPGRIGMVSDADGAVAEIGRASCRERV